ncbi:hypothetical protein C6341_g20281 [Phytophthora cactorum]|nr:hypothetical protein C6341_g20281 [Phytophthora cactorum]
MSIYVPAMVLLVFGLAPFKANSPCRVNLKRFSRYFFAYMTLAGVFPFYKALYEFIPAKFRGIVVVILPLWRLAAKNFMMYSVQSKLFIETVLLLQYELAHLGTDFSSRFEWLKN